MAVSFYKLVSERGVWGDDPVREGEARWKLAVATAAGGGTEMQIARERAKEDAVLKWSIASERGVETAQNNLAYILDQGWSLKFSMCLF